ncbi:MAG: glutamate racemase [Cellvibrionaceae bacterium]
MEHLAHALVIDSGVGALSIIEEIRARLPHISLSYASDNAFFPYGEKQEDELVDRVHKLATTLVDITHPDIIVIACNTASTVALPRVRSHFKTPIVGVVPAIKPAALESQTKIIGLVGTPGTVNRLYTDQLISQYASDCTVIKVGSTALVQLAEQKLKGEKIAQQDIVEAMSPLLNHPLYQSVDTIILACTHFPLLREELALAIVSGTVKRDIRWLDSGKAIANRVEYLLNADQKALTGVSHHDGSSLPTLQSFFTKDTPEVHKLYPELAKRISDTVHIVHIPD